MGVGEWGLLKDLPMAGWELGRVRLSLGPSRVLHGMDTQSCSVSRTTQRALEGQ